MRPIIVAAAVWCVAAVVTVAAFGLVMSMLKRLDAERVEHDVIVEAERITREAVKS